MIANIYITRITLAVTISAIPNIYLFEHRRDALSGDRIGQIAWPPRGFYGQRRSKPRAYEWFSTQKIPKLTIFCDAEILSSIAFTATDR